MNRAWLIVPALLLACPAPTTPIVDSGLPAQAPSVTSVTPSSGPAAGGTSVTVVGANFLDGAKVFFGGVASTSVTWSSRRQLVAFVPAGNPGAVTVKVVNPDGQSGELLQSYTYLSTPTSTLEEAIVINPSLAEDTSGANPVRLTVSTQVTGNNTRGLGAGVGYRVEVGFATALSNPPKDSDFTWTASTYLGDLDGPVLGDKLRDVYQGDVLLPGAMGSTVLEYALAARVTTDNGMNWTLVDRDGIAGAVAQEQVPKVRVSRPLVGWCKLGGEAVLPPDTLSLKVGQPGVIIYGQVYSKGLTDQSGPGANIEAQLGYGVSGSDPTAWTWVAATYNTDKASGANDEYQATLPNPGQGLYQFAIRFRLSQGPWRHCDADGSDLGGFTTSQAGTLNVTPVGIDRCNLQFPPTLSSREGASTDSVYGRVWGSTVTELPGAAAGLTGELGYGPPGDMPSSLSWVWRAAIYNTEVAGGGEEFQAPITGPVPGKYAYAYRFKYQTGAYVYCDLDGSANGYSSAQAGVLTARPVDPIEACRLASVSSISIPSGDAVTATGRVLVTALSAAGGPTPGLKGQVGIGTAGTNAATSLGWGWKDATFAQDVIASQEDEFTATVHPAYTGSRAVSFRFSMDDGGTWTYCDLNGSAVSGYEINQQSSLTVSPHQDLEFCNTQFPAQLAQVADAGTNVFGQVFHTGATPSSALPWLVQLGRGQRSEDPGTAWVWQGATFNTAVGNNNEYVSSFSAPVGEYAYAFRFARDGGHFCYGDLDGHGANSLGQSWEGFVGDHIDGGVNVGSATVSP